MIEMKKSKILIYAGAAFTLLAAIILIRRALITRTAAKIPEDDTGNVIPFAHADKPETN